MDLTLIGFIFYLLIILVIGLLTYKSNKSHDDFFLAVEDPSENFQRVRDFVDAKNCAKLKSFQPDKLAEGFCYDMQLEAREKLKINRVRFPSSKNIIVNLLHGIIVCMLVFRSCVRENVSSNQNLYETLAILCTSVYAGQVKGPTCGVNV